MRNGFVLIELIVALVIIVLLAILAAPSYTSMVVNNRLQAAGESLYSDLELARSEAIRKQSNVYVVFQTGANWCYGLSDSNAACNCNTSNSCQLNSVERVVSSTNYPNVTMAVTGLTNNSMSFEGVHGMTGQTGQINFTDSSSTMSVAVQTMGGIRACSSTIGGYSPC